jgi:hypothetical protein
MMYPHLLLVFARAAKPLLAAVIAISAVSAAHGSVVLSFFPGQHGLGGDGDEAKLFIDKTQAGTGLSSSFGSLGTNKNALDNIAISASGDTYSVGSGFATFKSKDHGSATNPLTAFTFSPGDTNFDGVFLRGQIDSENGLKKETVTATINFTDTVTHMTSQITHDFTDLITKDFGRIGFDEGTGSDAYIVNFVTFSLASGAAGWNELKQIEFSVPGVVSTPVPEAPGLVMVLLAICGAVSLYGMQRIRRSAPNAS